MRFWVCIFVLLVVHHQFSRADKIMDNDSLYTEKHIRDIYISNPQRALQLLDEAESRKAFSIRLINELRSLSYRCMYMNKQAFMYARKSYLLDSITQKDPRHMLKMTVLLSELSSLMSKHNESMRYALNGIRQAQELKDREAEARLLFCIGENNWRLSLKDKAYTYFDRATELLRGSKEVRKRMLLSHYYGVEMGFLMRDSRIKEALNLADEHEKLIKKLEESPQVPEGYVDGQYSYLYAKSAYLYYAEKQYARAERYYRQYLATKDSRTPDGKMYSIPYLLLSKQYEKAIDNCKDFKELLRMQQDTLNAQYITVLTKEVQAHLGMHNYEEAAMIRGIILAITDSINNNDKRNAALELNAIYGVSEKDEYIAEQASQLKIKNISLCLLTGVVLLALFILWRFSHIVRYKNRMLAGLINEKDMEPEQASLKEQEELAEETDKESEGSEESEEEEQNRRIFQELNQIVVQKQLYLSPELSREDLAQIVHLNHARFARMIRECTGTNFNGYINELRINHAIKLMKEHPNYTIRAIADESGFNSAPILYTLFKKKTGMTPYEFKKAQETVRE